MSKVPAFPTLSKQYVETMLNEMLNETESAEGIAILQDVLQRLSAPSFQFPDATELSFNHIRATDREDLAYKAVLFATGFAVAVENGVLSLSDIGKILIPMQVAIERARKSDDTVYPLEITL